jgi:hypothetical protein
VIRYVYAALLFEAKVAPKAQCQCSSVSTKEHRNVMLGFVTAPRSLSRRTCGRLPAPATRAPMMIWQMRASGSPLTTDQARNRSHVTRLIRHRPDRSGAGTSLRGGVWVAGGACRPRCTSTARRRMRRPPLGIRTVWRYFSSFRWRRLAMVSQCLRTVTTLIVAERAIVGASSTRVPPSSSCWVAASSPSIVARSRPLLLSGNCWPHR